MIFRANRLLDSESDSGTAGTMTSTPTMLFSTYIFYNYDFRNSELQNWHDMSLMAFRPSTHEGFNSEFFFRICL